MLLCPGSKCEIDGDLPFDFEIGRVLQSHLLPVKTYVFEPGFLQISAKTIFLTDDTEAKPLRLLRSKKGLRA